MPTRRILRAALAAAATLVAPFATARAQVPTRPAADCGRSPYETVIVAAGAARSPARDSVARVVAYWFRPPVGPDRQSATVPVRVGRALGIDVGSAEGQGTATFLAAAHDAVAAAAHEHAFDRFAPDSVAAVGSLAVYFGRPVQGGFSPLGHRIICSASAMPGNPTPAFPSELLPELRATQVMTSAPRAKTFSRGSVRAVFIVDSLGVVDVESFHVLTANDPAFVREVRRVLPLMRYFPASIDGRPAPQAVEQQFTFERR